MTRWPKRSGLGFLVLENCDWDQPITATVWTREPWAMDVPPKGSTHTPPQSSKLYQVVLEEGQSVRLDSIDPQSVTVQYTPMIRPEGSGWRLSV